MAIIFDESNKRFIIETKNSEYAFEVFKDRYLVHLYYGAKIGNRSYETDTVPYTFAPYDDDLNYDMAINDRYSEFGFYGNGSFKASSLKLRSINGDCCTRFLYKDYEILKGRVNTKGIPCAKAQNDTETLKINLFDEVNNCDLSLYYTVFPDLDVISRYISLKNNGEKSVKIEKAMSICLDLPGKDYDMLSLYGIHGEECQMQRNPLFFGNQSIMSRRGASSHQHNPFMALAKSETTEENGEVYAFNLVYSGNFLDEVEVDWRPHFIGAATRVGIGLGEEDFGFKLEKGEEFYSPEGIMLYTNSGLGDMSRKIHRFVREAIVPSDPFEKRPVVLNTWEASYFDIDRDKLLAFADEAVKYNIDMLVMDDGWFGKRNNDDAALGDWYVNKDKFPEGLKPFIEAVKAKGIKFGIWIEPEMINPDSDLYRAHPEWCIGCKGRRGSLSRNQLVLDMANPEVLDYLKKSFKETFKDLPIDYIKWDFNRHITEPGSPYLPADRQDEASFRFMLGAYDLYFWFMENFPNVMLENCSGGGGRYDLAMMAVSTQIWASDNTFPKRRNYIQQGGLTAYPAYVMSCHVSDPTREKDVMRTLDYRFKVALGGMLGYELDILKMPNEVKEEISKQIDFYRLVEPVIKSGDYYRLISPFQNNYGISAHYYMTGEKDKILLSFLQNDGVYERTEFILRIKADENAEYKEIITGKKYTGKQLNAGISIRAEKEGEFGKLWYFEMI